MNSKETWASIMNSAIIIAIEVYKFLDVSIIFFLSFFLLCQFLPPPRFADGLCVWREFFFVLDLTQYQG